MFGALIMRKLQCFESVTSVIASDYSDDYFNAKNTGLLTITQSGETEDLKEVIRFAQRENILCFNVINKVESEIARMTQLGVFINSGREVSVATSKAFFCQVVVMCLIACWFAERKHPNKLVLERIELVENLKFLCMKAQVRTNFFQFKNLCGVLLSVILNLKFYQKNVSNVQFQETLNMNKFEIEEIAKEVVTKQYIAFLGKGLCEPIAHEAALKVKELSYMFAGAYATGEFKHGSIALIDGMKKIA